MTVRSYVRQLLPAQTLKWFVRKRNVWRAHRWKRLRAKLTKRHGAFSAAQLVSFCREAGIQEGGILFVQCSYNDLVTYNGTPYELLGALQTIVGPNGTLFMPAYSTNMLESSCRPFDVRREPTYTGIIPELFRREEGVIRSLHPRHSICGLGPRAAELLAYHENCLYADGPDSPFDRMRKANAQSLCLGMVPNPDRHSFMHWIEDIAPEKYPTTVHEGPFDCQLRDAEGRELRRWFYGRRAVVRNRGWQIAKHLGPNAMRTLEFHGIPLCIYFWPTLAEELVSLRDRGIVCLDY